MMSTTKSVDSFESNVSNKTTVKILLKMLNDRKISREEKEKVSKSILQGNYEITEHSEDNLHHPSASHEHIKRSITKIEDKQTELYVNRHRLPKPHFLEITTTSTNIPIISPKQLYQEKIMTIRDQHASTTSLRAKSPANYQLTHDISFTDSFHSSQTQPLVQPMTYSNYPIDGAKQYVEITKQQNNGSHNSINYRNFYLQCLEEDRKKKIQERKEQHKQEKEYIKQRKEHEKISIEKQIEIKKKLNDFRQTLKDHLIKKKEPRLGEIMRCLDDGLIYYIVEKYNGYSLSTEAILALISNAMGTSILTPDPSIDMPPATPLTIETTINPQDINLVPPISPSGLLASRTMIGSLTNNLSFSSMINNYQEFGRRSPPRNHLPPLGDTSPEHNLHIPNEIYASNQTIQNTNYFPKAHKSTGLRDPVVGYQPRGRSSSSDRNKDKSMNKSGKTLASGFRAKSPDTSPTPEERFQKSFLATSTSTTSMPLMVMSSELLQKSAKTYGVDSSVLYDPDNESDVHSIQSQSSSLTYNAQRAIQIMHNQLVSEGILPSLQPEQILTQQQIQELGLHEKSLDQIIDEVGKKYQQAMSSNNSVTSQTSSVKSLNSKKQPVSMSFFNDEEDFKSRAQSMMVPDQSNQPSEQHLPIDQIPLFATSLPQEYDTNLSENPHHHHHHPHHNHENHENHEKQEGNEEEIQPKPSTDEQSVLTSPKIRLPSTSFISSTAEPHPLLFYGSKIIPTNLKEVALATEIDQKLQELSQEEQERAKKRLIITSLHGRARDRYDELLQDFPLLIDGQEPSIVRIPPVKGPRQLKTEPSKQPSKPFKSYEEETMVMNNGVPAGSGLMLWRPRDILTAQGKYRRHVYQKKTELSQVSYPNVSNRPFVSST